MTTLTLTKSQKQTIDKLEKREKEFKASENILSDSSIFYGKHGCGKKVCIFELIKRDRDVKKFNKDLIKDTIICSTTIPDIISSLITDFSYDGKDENYMFSHSYKDEIKLNTNLILINDKSIHIWEDLYKKYYKKDLKVFFVKTYKNLCNITDDNFKKANKYDIVFLIDKYFEKITNYFIRDDKYRFNRLILNNGIIDFPYEKKCPLANFTWFVTNITTSDRVITNESGNSINLEHNEKNLYNKTTFFNNRHFKTLDYYKLKFAKENPTLYISEYYYCHEDYCSDEEDFSEEESEESEDFSEEESEESELMEYENDLLKKKEPCISDKVEKDMAKNNIITFSDLEDNNINIIKNVEELTINTFKEIKTTIKKAFDDSKTNNNKLALKKYFLILSDNKKLKWNTKITKKINKFRFYKEKFLKSGKNSIVVTKEELQKRSDLNLNFITDLILLDSKHTSYSIEKNFHYTEESNCYSLNFINRCLGYGRTKDLSVTFYANLSYGRYENDTRLENSYYIFDNHDIREKNTKNMFDPTKKCTITYEKLQCDSFQEIKKDIYSNNECDKSLKECCTIIILNDKKDLLKWNNNKYTFKVNNKRPFNKDKLLKSGKKAIVVDIDNLNSVLELDFIKKVYVFDSIYKHGSNDFEEKNIISKCYIPNNNWNEVNFYIHVNKGYQSLEEAKERLDNIF